MSMRVIFNFTECAIIEYKVYLVYEFNFYFEQILGKDLTE